MVAVRTAPLRVGREMTVLTLEALTSSCSEGKGSRWWVLVCAAERAREGGWRRVAVTLLAEVVGSGGVRLPVGLAEEGAVRLSLVGRGGTGGASEETLNFLFEPSSDTLRTMAEEDAWPPAEKAGADLSAASMDT